MFMSDNPQAVETIGEEDQDRSEQRVRQEPEGPASADDGERGGHEEDPGCGDAALSQGSSAERSEQNAGEDAAVFEGDDRTPALVRRAPLDEGVERHKDQRAREAQEAHEYERSWQVWREKSHGGQ